MYPVYGAHHLRKQVKKKKERKTTKIQINKQTTTSKIESIM